MKNLIKLLFIFNLSFFSYAEEVAELKYGFLESTLVSSFADARVAAKVWLEDIVSDNYEKKANIEFYDSADILYKDLISGKLNMVVFDLEFFFKHKKNIEKIAHEFWSLNTFGTVYSQYYLIAKKSLNAKGFKNIIGKSVAYKKGDLSAEIWLDKNSLGIYKSEAKKILKEIILVKKENTALLNIFFNKTDFAIVTKKTWEIATELNPSIKKKIEIIEKSEKIHMPLIGLFRKDVKDSRIKSFFKASENISAVEGGREIVQLLKFDSLFKVKDTDLNKMDKYYKEYFELKKKYK